MKSTLKHISHLLLVLCFTSLVVCTMFGLAQNEIHSIQAAYNMATTPDLSLID